MAQVAAGKPFSRNAIYVSAALFGVGLAAAIALWAKLGTTVFFESIRTGLAYCFG
jgi:hypothetical protein